MRRFLTIFMLCLLAALRAKAETVRGTPNEIFRPLSKQIVQTVVDQGTTKVGKVDLVQLLAELDTVEWRTFDIGFLSGSGGKRETSIYLVQDRMVVVNMLALQNLVGQPVHINRWALHEALGALGYPDEVYDLTVSLTFMAGDVSTMSFDARAKYTERSFSNARATTSERVYESNGGTTIVGGGGDAPIIEFKVRLLEHFMGWVRAHHPDYDEKKCKRAFQKLVRFSMELDMKGDKHNSTDFAIRNGTLWIDMGANLDPAKIYTEEYMDSVLEALAPMLFA